MYQHNKGDLKKKKFTLSQPHMRGGRYFYLFFNLSSRWAWTVNTISQTLFPLERDHVPIVQEAGWALEPVWTGRKNLASTAVGTRNCPACR